MDDLYRDYILEHYKHPRNFGELEPHDLEALEQNPLCGDELGVHILVRDGRIEDLRFHGHGCAISQAAASIASEELKGMTVEDAGALSADWMIDLLGIPVSATRRKCALLNLKAVRGALTGDGAGPRSAGPRPPHAPLASGRSPPARVCRARAGRCRRPTGRRRRRTG
jgi:nitrogen fixation NifU-like protein